MFIRTSAALAALLQLTAISEASEPATYVCVEERSIGWEPRDGQPDAIGEFAPHTAPMIVTFRPPKIEDNKVATLGAIEVSEEGKTYTYTSDECSMFDAIVQDRIFGIDRDVDDYLELCAQVLQGEIRHVKFGVGDISYYFTKDPGSRETPIRFTQWTIVGLPWAYVSQGTCSLVQ